MIDSPDNDKVELPYGSVPSSFFQRGEIVADC